MEALEEAYVATTQMLENELTENADTISEAAFEANQKVLEEAQSFITENLVSEAQAAETAAENGITELDTASSEAASSLNNFNAEIHEMRKYGGGVNNSVQFGDGSNGFPARVKDPMLSFFNFVPKIEEAADAVETVVRKALHPDLPPEYIEFLPKVEEVSESAAEEVETLGTQSENAAANVEQFGGTVSAVDKAVLALGLAAETAATKLHSIDTTTIYYMRNYGGGVNDSIQFGAETPGFASGLAFVPRDNLLARLHQGEAVLTAQEAYEWRQQKKMGSIEAAVAKLANAVAEMQEGFQANMNLYINKKHVASALSRDMGRSIGNREYTLLRGMGG